MRQTPEPPVRGFRQLIAWQKAIDLADRVLDSCDRVPARRGAGLGGQLRRAIVSIPSNIVEGHGRPTGEYLSYLRIARGSLREAETQIELLRRRGLDTIRNCSGAPSGRGRGGPSSLWVDAGAIARSIG